MKRRILVIAATALVAIAVVVTCTGENIGLTRDVPPIYGPGPPGAAGTA